MPPADTPRSHDSIAMTLHWLMAGLILAQIALGLYAGRLAAALRDPATPATLADIERTAFMFSLHKTLGIALLALALLRIGRVLVRPRPGLPDTRRRAEAFLAETVQRVLYAALILMPLSGWISHAAATGFAPIWWPFGQSLPFVPKGEAFAAWAGTLHAALVRIFLAALALHVAGALRHHLIDRDDTLLRMLPGRTPPAAPPRRQPPLRPRPGALSSLAAAAVLGAGLAIAVATGALAPLPPSTASSPASSPAQGVAPVPAPADWQVTGGRIALTVPRGDRLLSGSFAAWSAALVAESAPDAALRGYVDVVIETASLIPDGTEGAEETDGLRDLLAPESWPSAILGAEIGRDESGTTATGTLSFGDRTVPFAVPVDIEPQGDGTLSLRLRVELGALAPGAALTVALTAAAPQ